MSQFLFVVEIPPVPEASVGVTVASEWLKFERGAKSKLGSVKQSKQIGKNVWLLPAENSLPVLVELSNLANSNNLSYSALLISGEITQLTKL